MSLRGLAVCLVPLVILVAGCGDDDDSSVDAGALELEWTPDASVPAGPHTWTMALTNVSDAAVTVTFPTSQRGDAVLAADDEIVHRWAGDRFFQQQITETTIEPGATETIELDDDLSAVEPGTYDLVLTAAVLDPPAAVTERVTVVTP